MQKGNFKNLSAFADFIYEEIMTFDEAFSVPALMEAHRLCRRNKQNKRETIEFELNIGANLKHLSELVLERKYQPIHYRSFYVFEPKKRLIEALPYKHRIIQMSLCKNILAPELEKRLIYDNCACRVDKGSHFAVSRLEKHLHSYYSKYGNQGYFLKCDIRKYFQNINQDILLAKLDKCGFEMPVRALIERIVHGYRSDTRVGIPIGNQTSQWFALFYLDSVDRLIKEKLQIKYYVRYMDDLILIHPDRDYLLYCLSEISKAINSLKLELNQKTQITPLSEGIDFLGFHHRILPSGRITRRLRQLAKKRLCNNYKKLRYLNNENVVDQSFIKNRLNCFYAHITYGDCFKLNQMYMKKYGLYFCP